MDTYMYIYIYLLYIKVKISIYLNLKGVIHNVNFIKSRNLKIKKSKFWLNNCENKIWCKKKSAKDLKTPRFNIL